MKRMNQDLKTIHDKSRSRNFYLLSRLGRLFQDPEEPESQGQKQPILQPTEKVLIGVRGTLKIYGISMSESQKRVEKFQEVNISSQIFN